LIDTRILKVFDVALLEVEPKLKLVFFLPWLYLMRVKEFYSAKCMHLLYKFNKIIALGKAKYY